MKYGTENSNGSSACIEEHADFIFTCTFSVFSFYTQAVADIKKKNIKTKNGAQVQC